MIHRANFHIVYSAQCSTLFSVAVCLVLVRHAGAEELLFKF